MIKLERSDSFETIPLDSANEIQALFHDITQAPDYQIGTDNWRHLSANFESSVNNGFYSGLNYIAEHSNPHKTSGMFHNALSFVTDHQMALNRNCTFCSKAVDMNLTAMTSRSFDSYYVATETSQGGLNPNVEHMKSLPLIGDTVLSSILESQVKQGEKAIIVVPQKGSRYSHAMNFIHHGGGMVAIDGQSRKLYDFNDEMDRKVFNRKYGNRKEDKDLKVLTIYHTGTCPEIRNEDWELI